MILLIDNYDSFAHNLARYLELLGHCTHVVRNDAIHSSQVAEWPVAAIVISPGPCSPSEAGESLPIVQRWYRDLPILGVCLGHQTIVQALGGRIYRTANPMHGTASDVTHDGAGEFESIPNPFVAGRYHSLVADPGGLPHELCATAQAPDGTIMAVRHRDYPVVGWQFHPESILTPVGLELLGGFLRWAGLPASGARRFTQEFTEREATTVRLRERNWPARPITF